MSPIYVRLVVELTVIIGIAVVLLRRNNRIYKYGINVLCDPRYTTAECVQRYDRLPSYGRMMFQWWRRDWSDYLEGKRSEQ